MAASSDFIKGEEIDDLLLAINKDIFWEDERFLEDVDSYVTEIENISDFPKKMVIFDRTIDVNNFSGLLRNCLNRMEEDECLPVGIHEEYKNYELSPDDIAHTYNCLQHVVNEFTLRGDGEKFYPLFFNCVQRSECLLPRLSKDASLFLGFDLANRIVAFLSHGYFHTETSGFQRTFSDISAVEFIIEAIICYLGGYVFATLSRRIRNSKNWNSKLSQDNLKILIAGKALNDHNDLTFVNIKDRGGLWKVRPEVCKIFSVAELLFKSVCNGFVHCMDSK